MSLLRSYSPRVPQVAPAAPVATVARIAGSKQPQYVPVVKDSKAKNKYDKLINKLVEKTTRGLSNSALNTRANRDGWTKSERRRYVRLRTANDADDTLNKAMRRLGRGHTKNAREILESEEKKRLLKQNRRLNAEAYVKNMRKIRIIRRDELNNDVTFRNDYYPHRKQMIRFLENDKVLSLVRNNPTKERLFSKTDLLEAGLLKELHEWIVWPIEVYEILNSEYPDVKFRKKIRNNRNYQMEFFQGYDLKVVSLILGHLLGGIKKRVFRNQRFRQEIVYFPFYTSSYENSQSKKIELDLEENLKFENQREGLNKKTKTNYMHWNLSPYDYGPYRISNQSGSFSKRLWEELGAKELLKTFKAILRNGNVEEPSPLLFPGMVGLKDWGIQEELNKAQGGAVGVNYKWPGYEDGLPTLDSPLLVRLKYLISVWDIQKRMVDNTN